MSRIEPDVTVTQLLGITRPLYMQWELSGKYMITIKFGCNVWLSVVCNVHSFLAAVKVEEKIMDSLTKQI